MSVSVGGGQQFVRPHRSKYRRALAVLVHEEIGRAVDIEVARCRLSLVYLPDQR
jgi:hypothetical protein